MKSKAQVKQHIWVIQTYTGKLYGWEDDCAEDNLKEAKQRLKEYRENQPEYMHRIKLQYVK